MHILHQVFEDERRGAEIDYLKRFGPQWLKAGGHQDRDKDNTSEEFIQEHPRFKEFVESRQHYVFLLAHLSKNHVNCLFLCQYQTGIIYYFFNKNISLKICLQNVRANIMILDLIINCLHQVLYI
jgi:hypothetical protein